MQPLRSILPVFVALTLGCGTTAAEHPAADATAILSRLQARYAQAHHYSESGVAVHVAADGAIQRVHFTTSFARDSALRFEYWREGERETSSLALPVEPGRPAPEAVSELEAATGVSLYASRFTPLLLLGVDPCDCLSSGAVAIMGLESWEGESVKRVLIHESARARVTFWVAADDSLRGVEILHHRDQSRSTIRLTRPSLR